MFAAPESITNYFNMIRVDESTVRSNPPYIGWPTVRDRTFGGLVVSQALNAFITLNPDRIPHTVNYKFLAPVKTSIPLQFKLTHFEDGEIASLAAHQQEKLVGMGHIRYGHHIDHLDSFSIICPEYIGAPKDYSTIGQVAKNTMEGLMGKVMEELHKFPLEIRPVESPLLPSSNVDRCCDWLRIKQKHRDEIKPNDGLSLAMFISDYFIGQVAHGIFIKENISSRIPIKTASLHHSVWIHDDNIDPLAWHLTVVECRVISFGRVRLESRIFNETRKCVLTVIQELYMQCAEERKNKL